MLSNGRSSKWKNATKCCREPAQGYLFYKQQNKGAKKKKLSMKIPRNLGEEEVKRLPFIVIIIDELADIMPHIPKKWSGYCATAQMARAWNSSYRSTQRPSVEVLTGLIKANIGTRIAFKWPRKSIREHSGYGGAEKLLRKRRHAL